MRTLVGAVLFGCLCGCGQLFVESTPMDSGVVDGSIDGGRDASSPSDGALEDRGSVDVGLDSPLSDSPLSDSPLSDSPLSDSLGPDGSIAPTAILVFPPSGSVTVAENVRVVVAVSDPVAVMTIGGAPLRLRGGDEYEADLELSPGDNSLEFEGGATAVTLGSVRREYSLMEDLRLTGNATRLYVGAGSTILGVDPTSGEPTPVVAPGIGSGVPLDGIVGLALDDSSTRLVVATNRELFMVALGTGVRTLISGAARGTGPSFIGVHGILVEGNDIFITSATNLLHVDATTGDRVVVSGGTSGGSVWSFPRGIDRGGSDISLFVASEGRIIEVSESTGFRRLVASSLEPLLGSGAELRDMHGIVYDDLDVAFAISRTNDALLRVNLDTGERVQLNNDRGVGFGLRLDLPADLLVDASRGRFLVADHSADAILSIDRSTGLVTPFFYISAGSGEVYSSFNDLRPCGSNVCYINNPGRLTAIEPDGRRVLTSYDVPLGVFTFSVAPDGDAYSITTTTTGARLVRSPASGDPAVTISSATEGSGPVITRPSAVEFDTSTGRVLVGDSSDGSIFSVTTETGTRRLISGPTRGSGPAITDPESIISVGAASVFVLDGSSGELFEVNLTSGERAVLHDSFQSIQTLAVRGSQVCGVLQTRTHIACYEPVDASFTEFMVDEAIFAPYGGAFLPGRDVLYIANFGGSRTAAVDIVSGQSVLIAR